MFESVRWSFSVITSQDSSGVSSKCYSRFLFISSPRRGLIWNKNDYTGVGFRTFKVSSASLGLITEAGLLAECLFKIRWSLSLSLKLLFCENLERNDAERI